MWYAFAIFIASTLALASFLGYKLYRLRMGMTTGTGLPGGIALPFSVRETENRIRRAIRTKSRIALLYGLRYSVFGMHFVKQKIDKAVAKVHRLAAHHEKRIVSAHIEETQAGAFLETIQEYKLTVPTPAVKPKKPRAPRKPRVKAESIPAPAVEALVAETNVIEKDEVDQ